MPIANPTDDRLRQRQEEFIVARKPRLILPGQPLHFIHRGNDRMTIFRDAADFDKCISLLCSTSLRSQCPVHGYVLMDNHFHLVATPVDEHGPATFMQSFGTSYVRYFNDRYGRTGTLWEGRYGSFPITSERYFFDCSRYVEMNPVRALMAANPGDYVRSSFRCNAFGDVDPLVTPHPLYESLGASAAARHVAYQQLFAHHLDPAVLDAFRQATRTGKPVGDQDDDSEPRIRKARPE